SDFRLKAEATTSPTLISSPEDCLPRSYEPRTSAVRLLWVFAGVPALHTEPMPVAGAATAFITGADGLLGTTLVRVLRGLGHPVFALARSADAAEGLRSAGATPVVGDLLDSGGWQDEA